MAVPLEEEIMKEIGFGNHYYWYNSILCAGLRTRAALSVEGAIREHYNARDEIGEPDPGLIATLLQIMDSEPNDDSLTYTWQAASEIIGIHIRYDKSEEEVKKIAYENLDNYLAQRFLSKPLDAD